MTSLVRVFGSLALVHVLIAANGCAQAPGESACVLRLKVMDRDAVPSNGVPVELIDANGLTVASTVVKDGEAEICDADFGVYAVRVWGNGCLPTTVSGITFRAKQPLRLTVIANRCENVKDHRTGCWVYLRLATADRAPIEGAEAWHAKTNWKVAGDRLGRIDFPVGRGATTRVSVGAPGYKSQVVSLACQDIEDIERRVVLERQE